MTKKYFVAIQAFALLLLATCFTSCSEEEVGQAGTGLKRLTIRFRAGDALAVESRATQAGWNDGWNENKIERLDLFIFEGDGTFVRHIPSYPLEVEDASSYQTWDDCPLSYKEVANNQDSYIYYMVANCSGLEGFEGTLTELARKTNGVTLKHNDEQEAFVMDGQGTLAITDATNKTATLTFDLSRAAAKIMVTINNEKDESILEACQFQLCHYTVNPTSVLTAGETYAAGDPLQTEEQEAAPALVYDDNAAVYYTYPNDWFDQSKVSGSGDEWTIEDYNTSNPILPERETYVLLRAPYEGQDYYYKVPVNFATYDKNDQLTFTEDELDEIHDLYRVKRNHVYAITVTIDREGGSVQAPVVPEYYVRINDWQPGGDYDLGAGDFN